MQQHGIHGDRVMPGQHLLHPHPTCWEAPAVMARPLQRETLEPLFEGEVPPELHLLVRPSKALPMRLHRRHTGA